MGKFISNKCNQDDAVGLSIGIRWERIWEKKEKHKSEQSGFF